MKIKINNTLYEVLSIEDAFSPEFSSPTKIVRFSNLSYEEIKNLFYLGINWSQINYIEVEEYDKEIEDYIIKTIPEEQDLSEYCIPGRIIDERNGIVSIEMHQLSAKEILPSPSLVQSKKFIDAAKKLRTNLSDTLALENIDLFPIWESDHSYIKEERLQYENFLYKVIIDHISTKDILPSENSEYYQKIIKEEV